MNRFRPYFRLLLPVKWHFIAAILCGVIYGLSSGFGLPFAADWIFPKIFQSEQTGLIGNEASRKLGEDRVKELDTSLRDQLTPAEREALGPVVEEEDDFWTLLAYVAILPLVFGIRGVSGFCNNYLINRCGIHVLEEIRGNLFRKLQVLPLSFYQRHPSGEIVSRVIADTAQLQTAVTFVANDLVRQPVTFLGAIGALVFLALRQNELLFLLLCLGIIPVFVLPIRFVGKKMLAKARLMQAQAGDFTSILNENLSAPKEIRAFNLGETETRRFMASVRRFFIYRLKVVKYSQILTPTIEFLSATIIAFAVFYAARKGVTLEQVVPLVFALYMSYEPIKKLGAINNHLRQGTASLERIEYILNAPVDIEDPADPLPFDDVRGEVRFDRVSFSYAETPTLSGIDLTVPPGQVVALVGPSGAGKSTLAALVSRFYDVREGTIRIDGKDIRQVSKQDLHNRIALVSQETVLFNDTVANNIRIGRLSASPAEVVEAARQANADSFIRLMPEGYDTIVGEKGTRLSGGQRQRIALARAFLRNAPILILDEATSALDTESERQVQDALEKLLPGKTAFIIAHRFSTIRKANRILVFDHGRIIADGTHEELYESSPLYRDLYDKQA